ncbi:MAG: S-methyl-5'-thioadenosine phosphorylase [Candidatus Tectomicrobia bacterium]|nr:S-methyl-5'-thioadenosine phosphorylase [Candidatus Tectomicrobia bacterium]
MNGVKVGVIGGSGLYEMKGLQDVKRVALDTPFGKPSDEYITGVLDGVEMVFLPRHGRGHRIMPSEINFRANIYGMKSLGVEWIISVSAVGSMREDIAPGDMVIPDQFFDRTTKRISTFFGGGVVGHIAMADPVCPNLHDTLISACRDVGATAHPRGTYLCIEGPQFSTRAESYIYRQWGVDVIGMTNIPEVKLAREAEICYATLALATDYDCWHQTAEDVSVVSVLEILNKNVELAQQIIRSAVAKISHPRRCPCPELLKHALITSRDAIPEQLKRDLAPLIGKYVN